MYPNGNYPFVYVCHEKKLYSCHRRSSSSWCSKKVKILFIPKAKHQSCIPTGTICLCLSRKETRFMPWTKFIPLVPNKMKGLNPFFLKPKHLYCVSWWYLPICLCPSRRVAGFFPRTKFVLLIPNKRRVEILFSRNQIINIVYPNGNYVFVLACHEKKLDSWNEQSSSCFKDELWFPTNWRVEILFFTKPRHQYRVSQ